MDVEMSSDLIVFNKYSLYALLHQIYRNVTLVKGKPAVHRISLNH